MEGDSVLNAAWILSLGAWCAIDASNARLKRIENAFALICLACVGLLLVGYDVRIGWRFLEEGAFIAAAFMAGVAVVRWGRKELAEGEYDEPYQAP